nr:ABC transporter ATP-binding protein [Lactococcus insecticola]
MQGRPSPEALKRELKTLSVTPNEMIRFIAAPVLKRRGLLVFNLAILIFLAFLNFMVPQFTKTIIDTAIADKNLTELWQQVILMLATTALIGVVGFASAYMMQKLSQEAITEVRLDTYNKLLKQDYAYFQETKTGDLMVRLTSDIGNLQALISSDTFEIVSSIVTFFGVLGFLFWENWQLALMVTLTFPILFVNIRFFRGRMRQAFSDVRANSSKISNQLQSTLTEIELIKNYTTEDFETDKFDRIVSQGNRYQLIATKWQAIFSPIITFINTGATAIVLWFGGYLVIKNQMTVGDLVAYLSYLVMLQDPVRRISRLINMFQTALVSYDRVEQVMRSREMIAENKAAVPFPARLSDKIAIKNLTFYYQDSKLPALDDISMDVLAGQTTALVGRSGSGKSTLIKLLTRMYDVSGGDICYDGTSIKDLQLKSLRQNIAVVSQDVAIVDGTIADNIRYGSFSATNAQVERAMQMANIADFIHTLPDGLETQVGERGVKLSGGQKQRLSIARAILKDAPIIILDEATAALDNESERLIQRALDNLMVGRTSIVIAHRLSTVYKAEKIIVINAGKIAETGTHDDLLAHNGIYKTLYDMQFD